MVASGESEGRLDVKAICKPLQVTTKLDVALKNYDPLIQWETGLSAYQKAPS